MGRTTRAYDLVMAYAHDSDSGTRWPRKDIAHIRYVGRYLQEQCNGVRRGGGLRCYCIATMECSSIYVCGMIKCGSDSRTQLAPEWILARPKPLQTSTRAEAVAAYDCAGWREGQVYNGED
ncbi:hypothetical protein EJ02DRAFT_455256 [Clathrospora elynae]|uniref:Uncharacterized protein n=1 Tax=Clathrospora elynae TaxID=706981 RepID=A0A6A5SPA8_9PLEO|nr:hypothetical protein EJ02DRAFT_455256 [Clathrospora elynae]